MAEQGQTQDFLSYVKRRSKALYIGTVCPRCRGLVQGLASLPLCPAPNSDSAFVKIKL